MVSTPPCFMVKPTNKGEHIQTADRDSLKIRSGSLDALDKYIYNVKERLLFLNRTNKQLLMHNDRYILLLQFQDKYTLAKLYSLHFCMFLARL